METMVLSGPADRVTQARLMLQSKGLAVETSQATVRSNAGPVQLRDYNHGFEPDGDEAFVTASGGLDDWRVVEPLGFVLRMHWVSGAEGEWRNDRQPDPVSSLEARLRSAGFSFPEA
jgi:hypothetical protein